MKLLKTLCLTLVCLFLLAQNGLADQTCHDAIGADECYHLQISDFLDCQQTHAQDCAESCGLCNPSGQTCYDVIGADECYHYSIGDPLYCQTHAQDCAESCGLCNPSGQTCHDVIGAEACYHLYISDLLDCQTYALDCAESCGLCNPSVDTQFPGQNTTTQAISTESIRHLQPNQLQFMRLKTRFNQFVAVTEAKLQNLTNGLSRLNKRPVVNPSIFANVSSLVETELTPIRKEISDIKRTLQEMKTLLIPTVDASCYSNGDLSYSQKYIAICPGNCNESLHFVWGTQNYTTDSYLCAAAIHDGKINGVSGGQVTINRLAGQLSYNGSTQNNITSQDYREWKASFRFE